MTRLHANNFLQIHEADNEETHRSVMEEELVVGLAAEAGYRKPLPRLRVGDKPELISMLTTYHLFIKVKAHMDLFKSGLDHLE